MPALCDDLQLDDATVSLTVWGPRGAGDLVRGGGVAKLECSSRDHAFTHSAAPESRLLVTCAEEKWSVPDTSLCPDKSDACTNPISVSCAKTDGCEKLTKSFQDRVVHDPFLDFYHKGASVTLHCSDGTEPFATFEPFNDPSKVLAVKMLVFESLDIEVDNDFCPHADCLPSLGVEWNGLDGTKGTDCIEDKDGAYCIQSASIQWDGTKFVFTDYCDETARTVNDQSYGSYGTASRVLTTEDGDEKEKSSWRDDVSYQWAAFKMDLGCDLTFDAVMMKNSHFGRRSAKRVL